LKGTGGGLEQEIGNIWERYIKESLKSENGKV